MGTWISYVIKKCNNYQWAINRIYLNYLDLHLKSKLFMANLAQYKIPMQKELWCIKNRKKNCFGVKVVISRIIILFNLCILINHSSFKIEVYFISPCLLYFPFSSIMRKYRLVHAFRAPSDLVPRRSNTPSIWKNDGILESCEIQLENSLIE